MKKTDEQSEVGVDVLVMLPCPFCGCGAVVEAIDKSNIFWRGKCETCSARSATATSKDTAIARWNERV